MGLAPTFQDISTLFCGNHRITVKIGGPLLKFCKVLYGLQGALRAEQTLDIYPTKRWNVQPVPELLRADISYQMSSGIGMPIDMAVEACNTPAGKLGTTVIGLVKLLLGKRCNKQPETLYLLGIQNSIEQFKVIHNGDDFPLRHIAKIRPGRQIDGRRKLRQ